MTDEEIVAYCPECGPVKKCDEDGLCLGCGCTVFLSNVPWFAAALREARVDGARKGIEAAADHTEDLFDLCGPFPARKILSDLADAIRALDPAEVVR